MVHSQGSSLCAFFCPCRDLRRLGGCGSDPERKLRCGGRVALCSGPYRATRKGFCRRHSRTGLPYSRNRPREPRLGISLIS